MGASLEPSDEADCEEAAWSCSWLDQGDPPGAAHRVLGYWKPAAEMRFPVLTAQLGGPSPSLQLRLDSIRLLEKCFSPSPNKRARFNSRLAGRIRSLAAVGLLPHSGQ